MAAIIEATLSAQSLKESFPEVLAWKIPGKRVAINDNVGGGVRESEVGNKVAERPAIEPQKAVTPLDIAEAALLVLFKPVIAPTMASFATLRLAGIIGTGPAVAEEI